MAVGSDEAGPWDLVVVAVGSSSVWAGALWQGLTG